MEREKEVLLRLGKDALVRVNGTLLTDYVVARDYDDETKSWGYAGKYYSASTGNELENLECLAKASQYLL